MSQSYAEAKALYASLPPFQPVISPALLPYIALITLASFFVLAFLFTTLPKGKNPVPELGITVVASGLAGWGVIALFCTLGVYV